MKKVFIGWGARFALIVGLVFLCIGALEYEAEKQNFFENGPRNAFVDYALGFGLGVRDFIVDTARCIFHLVRHPIASAQEMIRAVVHYQDTYIAVKTLVVTTIENYPYLSFAEKGRLHARIAAETLYMAGVITVPAVGLSKFKSAKDAAVLFSRRAAKTLPKKWQGPTKFSVKLQQPVSLAEWFAYEGQPAGR